jgi:sulfate adenylyltransferase
MRTPSRAHSRSPRSRPLPHPFFPGQAHEAFKVFGTSSLEHPGVYDLATNRGRFYYGGQVFGLEVPAREMVCASPREVRATLPKGKPVVAFQCRNPIHRAHFELVRRVLEDVKDSTVLIHPTCGPTQPGDIDGIVRVATYKALEAEVGSPRIHWAFLPFNMRMAGPREAIQHMIVRKNFGECHARREKGEARGTAHHLTHPRPSSSFFPSLPPPPGCTHFIIGRDMAGTKSTRTQEDLYGPYDAQALGKARAAELNMGVVCYENMVYVGAAAGGYAPETEAKAKGLKQMKLSGTEFRRLLRAGEPIPDWFAFSSVIKALRDYEMKQKV